MIKTFKEWVKLKETAIQQQQFDPKQIKPVQWRMPNIMEERGEISRQAQTMGMDWRQLMYAFRKARLVPLNCSQGARFNYFLTAERLFI